MASAGRRGRWLCAPQAPACPSLGFPREVPPPNTALFLPSLVLLWDPWPAPGNLGPRNWATLTWPPRPTSHPVAT